MEKIELAFKHFSLPANASRLIRDCKESSEGICARSSGRGDIPKFVATDGSIGWNLLNSVQQQTCVDRNPVFCEWGSGVGLVTLLASLMGMSATGIEIEEELIDIAEGFSRQYKIPASFVHASVFLKDNPLPQINYSDVDIFYVYPWPNEIVKMISLFEQVARRGAILVCYHGGRNYRVLRR